MTEYRQINVRDAGKYRIHVHRSIGNVSISIDVPPDVRDEAVLHAEQLLKAIPEMVFNAPDGVVISSVPNFPPQDGTS